MRYGLFALALTALVAFAAAPAVAGCAAHDKVAEKPASTTVAGTPQQSKPSGG